MKHTYIEEQLIVVTKCQILQMSNVQWKCISYVYIIVYNFYDF